MNFKFILAAASAAITFGAQAQTASISATTPDGRTVTATAITPNIIRVDNTASGQMAAPVQSVLDLAPGSGIASVNAAGTVMHTAAGITAEIDSKGVLTLSSLAKGTTVADFGERTTPDGSHTLTLGTTGSGSFYGAGERGHSYRLNGDTLVMYNRQNYGYTGNDPRISQMNITMPLLLNSNGYAIVFDDYAAAKLIAGRALKYTTESNRPVTYYYIGGVDDMAGLTSELTELTGRQPLPPLWALGYITSKYGYRTQDETIGTVDTLKQHGYPLDGIVLDLYWYGKEQDMGRLAWEPSQWPDPEGMLGELNRRGVKTVTISQPYVLRNGRAIDNYRELASKGMFVADSTGKAPQEVVIWVGEGGMFDVANPDTRRWLTERYKSLTDMGVGGWWGDLGEPEVHPETGLHANGLTARLYHNRYGNDWSSIISELYASEYPDTRLLTLMRGGTTGLQRHSVFPWSTDVSRSWGGLEPQVRIMLNSGLSGLGYMSSDLGGFAVDEASPYMPELYVRWVQSGLFSPVFRTHAQQYAEPYNYPQYEDILKAIVSERYRWLPYNYTLAYENAAFGWPLVRPLDFTGKASGRYDSISDQYMWGSEVMVAPVMTEGAISRKVIFPEGCTWIDYNNPSQRYEGGTTVADYPAPLDCLPLFVREGAFIPTADYPMENTGDYRADEFTVTYYASAGKSHYTLYDDNRMSPRAIADGQYRLIHFTGEMTDDAVNITISPEGTYPGAPDAIALHMRIVLPDGSVRAYSLQLEPGKTSDSQSLTLKL
ncbi:MAG: DUF5110 domain-containing protein [Muribaculaceae bacterium]|nr:DUF5110 domain-containing protein [Muribaculaceae bacterium]